MLWHKLFRFTWTCLYNCAKQETLKAYTSLHVQERSKVRDNINFKVSYKQKIAISFVLVCVGFTGIDDPYESPLNCEVWSIWIHDYSSRLLQSTCVSMNMFSLFLLYVLVWNTTDRAERERGRVSFPSSYGWGSHLLLGRQRLPSKPVTSTII